MNKRWVSNERAKGAIEAAGGVVGLLVPGATAFGPVASALFVMATLGRGLGTGIWLRHRANGREVHRPDEQDA